MRTYLCLAAITLAGCTKEPLYGQIHYYDSIHSSQSIHALATLKNNQCKLTIQLGSVPGDTFKKNFPPQTKVKIEDYEGIKMVGGCSVIAPADKIFPL